MLKLIKLITYRVGHDKGFLITYLVLIPIVMAIAVYFTNSMSKSLQVAVVNNVEVVENESIEYVYLDEMPDTSKLVLNQYSAIIVKENNEIKVVSTMSKESNQAIQLLVTGQLETLPSSEGQRGTASNIIGFLMMVISLLGVQVYQYYFQERKGINKRIMSASIRSYQYMLSHFLVVFGFMFIPALCIICGALYVFDITLSIALWQFILVLFLLCLFATGFGLWINSLSKTIDESMMLGNMFAIVGTIISGGFVQVTDNQIFNTIVQVFPQKQIMLLLEALENNTSLPVLGTIYVVILSFVLIIIAIIIEKKKLPSR